MNLSDVMSLIRSRRSIRRYTAQPIERELLETLLEAARWAPSAHNRQPWRFAVITSGETRERLARAMGDQLRADRKADHAPAEAIEADATRSYARITGAAALIMICLSMVDMDRYPDERRAALEYTLAVQSTSLATQNLLLAAHEAGLGGCWVCAPLFCPEVVRRALDLPGDWEPQALITLGYPAETKEKTRFPLADCVIWRD